MGIQDVSEGVAQSEWSGVYRKFTKGDGYFRQGALELFEILSVIDVVNLQEMALMGRFFEEIERMLLFSERGIFLR
jgi:hypothetical protein